VANSLSRAAARGAAVQALVTGAVADHEGAAFVADRRVAVFDVDEGAFLAGTSAHCRPRGIVDLERGEWRFVHLDAEGLGFFRRQEFGS